MERLTKRTTNCPLPVLVRDRAFGPAYFVSEEDYTDYRDALEKLARYEDTGLEPEEIKRSDALLRGFIDLGRRHARTLSLIEKVMIADREGRLLVLPCKVGGKVFRASCSSGDCVTEIKINRRGYHFKCWWGWFHKKDIGKTVFFAREDAEKALEGLRSVQQGNKP